MQTQGLLIPCSFAAKWRPTGHVFWHAAVHPNKGDLLYLIRNKGRLLIEQIQATVFSNQFVRDRYARAKRQEVVSAKKKFQKKFKKKKRLTNTI